MRSFRDKFSIILIIFLSFYNLALATDYSGSNFIVRDPIMGDFGSRATSTNFEQFNAGGQTVTGQSSSTNFILKQGFLYYDDFAPKSQNWRWYLDFPNETPNASAANENTAPSNISKNTTLKLRLTIKETSNTGYLNMKYKLQYSTTSNFVQAYDLAEQVSCSKTSIWCYADGGGADNALITTKLLSDSDPCASSLGNGCGTHNESGISASAYNHKMDAAAEFEFTIKASGATMDTTYFFRGFDTIHNQPVPINVGESYPSLVIAGAQLNFTVNGISSGQLTGGVVTDVSTTPTSVDFGHLPFGTSVKAAQNLNVTTNATEGFEIFVLQRQGLVGPAAIASVDGTNESPLPWAIPNGATGAYGYHTDDPILAGGSTRFSLDDTYAKFESAAKEVSYSSGPVTSDNTDIVYRVQVTNQQLPGDYSGSIMYIIVPTF